MTRKRSPSHLRLAERRDTPGADPDENVARGAATPGTLMRPGLALRNFRSDRGLTLAVVSERTGLPVSTLSKIETGKMELTIDKLLRISLALDVNVADIFGTPSDHQASASGSRRRSITRADEGYRLESHWGAYRYQAYELLNKSLTPAIIEVKSGNIEEFGELHHHRGEEFIYVISGELALYTDTYTPSYLKAGDTAYFDSDMAHGYVAIGDETCRILSVFSTPDSEIVNSVEAI